MISSTDIPGTQNLGTDGAKNGKHVRTVKLLMGEKGKTPRERGISPKKVLFKANKTPKKNKKSKYGKNG